eukprot:g2017.t1
MASEETRSRSRTGVHVIASAKSSSGAHASNAPAGRGLDDVNIVAAGSAVAGELTLKPKKKDGDFRKQKKDVGSEEKQLKGNLDDRMAAINKAKAISGGKGYRSGDEQTGKGGGGAAAASSGPRNAIHVPLQFQGEHFGDPSTSSAGPAVGAPPSSKHTSKSSILSAPRDRDGADGNHNRNNDRGSSEHSPRSDVKSNGVKNNNLVSGKPVVGAVGKSQYNKKNSQHAGSSEAVPMEVEEKENYRADSKLGGLKNALDERENAAGPSSKNIGTGAAARETAENKIKLVPNAKTKAAQQAALDTSGGGSSSNKAGNSTIVGKPSYGDVGKSEVKKPVVDPNPKPTYDSWRDHDGYGSDDTLGSEDQLAPGEKQLRRERREKVKKLLTSKGATQIAPTSVFAFKGRTHYFHDLRDSRAIGFLSKEGYTQIPLDVMNRSTRKEIAPGKNPAHDEKTMKPLRPRKDEQIVNGVRMPKRNFDSVCRFQEKALKKGEPLSFPFRGVACVCQKRKTDQGRQKTMMAGVEAALALRRRGGAFTVSGLGQLANAMSAKGFENIAQSGLMRAPGMGEFGTYDPNDLPPIDRMEMFQKHKDGRLLTAHHNLLSMYKNRLMRGESPEKRLARLGARAGLGADLFAGGGGGFGEGDELDDEEKERLRQVEKDIKRRKRGEMPVDVERQQRKQAKIERRQKKEERRKARADRRQKRRQERILMGNDETLLSDSEDSSSSSSSSSSGSSSRSSSRSDSRRQREDSGSDPDAPWDPVERLRRMKIADELRKKQEAEREKKHYEALKKLEDELKSEASKLGITVEELKVRQEIEAEREKERKAEEMRKEAEDEERQRREICAEKGWDMEELLEREIMAAEQGLTLEELEAEMKKPSFWKKIRGKKPAWLLRDLGNAFESGGSDSDSHSGSGSRSRRSDSRSRRSRSRSRSGSRSSSKRAGANKKKRFKFDPKYGLDGDGADGGPVTTLDADAAAKMRRPHEKQLWMGEDDDESGLRGKGKGKGKAGVAAGMDEEGMDSQIHFPGWETVEDGVARGRNLPTVASILGKDKVTPAEQELLGSVLDTMPQQAEGGEKGSSAGTTQKGRGRGKGGRHQRLARAEDMPIPGTKSDLRLKNKAAGNWFGEAQDTAEEFLQAAANKAREEFLRRALKSLKAGKSLETLDFASLMREDGLEEGNEDAMGAAGMGMKKKTIEFAMQKNTDYEYRVKPGQGATTAAALANAPSNDQVVEGLGAENASQFKHLMEQAQLAREAQLAIRERQEEKIRMQQMLRPGENYEEALLRQQIQAHIESQTGGILPPKMGEAMPLQLASTAMGGGVLPDMTNLMMPMEGGQLDDAEALLEGAGKKKKRTKEEKAERARLKAEKKQKKLEAKKTLTAARNVNQLDIADAETAELDALTLEEVDEQTKELLDKDLVITSTGAGWQLKQAKEAAAAQKKKKKLLEQERAADAAEDGEDGGEKKAGEEPGSLFPSMDENCEFTLDDITDDKIAELEATEKKKVVNLDQRLRDMDRERSERKQKEAQEMDEAQLLREAGLHVDGDHEEEGEGSPAGSKDGEEALDEAGKAISKKKGQKGKVSRVQPIVGYLQADRPALPQLLAEVGESRKRLGQNEKTTNNEINLGSISIVAYGQKGPRDMVYEDSDEEIDAKGGVVKGKKSKKAKKGAAAKAQRAVDEGEEEAKDEFEKLVQTKVEGRRQPKRVGEVLPSFFEGRKKRASSAKESDSDDDPNAAGAKAAKKLKTDAAAGTASSSSSGIAAAATTTTTSKKRRSAGSDEEAAGSKDSSKKSTMKPPSRPPAKAAKFDSSGSIGKAPVIDEEKVALKSAMEGKASAVGEKDNVFYDDEGKPVYLSEKTGITAIGQANVGTVVMADGYSLPKDGAAKEDKYVASDEVLGSWAAPLPEETKGRKSYKEKEATKGSAKKSKSSKGKPLFEGPDSGAKPAYGFTKLPSTLAPIAEEESDSDSDSSSSSSSSSDDEEFHDARSQESGKKAQKQSSAPTSKAKQPSGSKSTKKGQAQGTARETLTTTTKEEEPPAAAAAEAAPEPPADPKTERELRRADRERRRREKEDRRLEREEKKKKEAEEAEARRKAMLAKPIPKSKSVNLSRQAEGQIMMRVDDQYLLGDPNQQMAYDSGDANEGEALDVVQQLQMQNLMMQQSYAHVMESMTADSTSGTGVGSGLRSFATGSGPIYKTRMCRFVAEKGWCPHGDRCTFAHSVEELPPSYKREYCQAYMMLGVCQHGINCKFAHGPDELRKRTGPDGQPLDEPKVVAAAEPEIFCEDVTGFSGLAPAAIAKAIPKVAAVPKNRPAPSAGVGSAMIPRTEFDAGIQTGVNSQVDGAGADDSAGAGMSRLAKQMAPAATYGYSGTSSRLPAGGGWGKDEDPRAGEDDDRGRGGRDKYGGIKSSRYDKSGVSSSVRGGIGSTYDKGYASSYNKSYDKSYDRDRSYDKSSSSRHAKDEDPRQRAREAMEYFTKDGVTSWIPDELSRHEADSKSRYKSYERSSKTGYGSGIASGVGSTAKDYDYNRGKRMDDGISSTLSAQAYGKKSTITVGKSLVKGTASHAPVPPPASYEYPPAGSTSVVYENPDGTRSTVVYVNDPNAAAPGGISTPQIQGGGYHSFANYDPAQQQVRHPYGPGGT